jgi:hypothetical protein
VNSILTGLFGACVAVAFIEAIRLIRKQREMPKREQKPVTRWLCYSDHNREDALLYKIQSPLGSTTVPVTFLALTQAEADAYCTSWLDAECWGAFENPELVPSGEVSQWG